MKLRKLLNQIRLPFKMLISYGLMAVIPTIFILVYLQVHFVYKLETNVLSLENQMIAQEVKAIEGYIEQMKNIADLISQSQNIHRLLISTDIQLKNLISFDPYKDPIHTDLENIRQKIDGDQILGIRIYCEDDTAVLQNSYLQSYEMFESFEKIRTSLWYGMANSRDADGWIVSPFFLNDWELATLGQISYIKTISYYVGGQEKKAYACVYFSRDYFDEVIGGYGDYPHSAIYMIDNKDGIVSMNGQDEYMSYVLSYSDIDSLMKEEQKFYLLEFGKTKLWSVYYNIGQDDNSWRMVFSVSRDAIIQAAQDEGMQFIGIYVLLTILLCMFMLHLSRSITDRVALLKAKMLTVKEELPEKVGEDLGRDEIGELALSYDHMAERIQSLVNEKVEMEINLLRAQINPHFLYNTLDMISWFAIKGKNDEVTESIQTLSRFYKLSLNHGESVTTLDKEIRLAEEYLKLQSKRVGCEILFLADIPDELLELALPQFLFQPLIENSLKYGILEKEHPKGTITLIGWQNQDTVTLVLSDDGKGMDGQAAAELLARIREKKSKTKNGHIGLRNVYQRLLLYYGEDGFSMKFASSPGNGMSIEFTLPMMRKTDE